MDGTSTTTRAIARYGLEGVPDARTSVHPFTTADGLGLQMLRFRREPGGDVVLLVHGLTSSSDMFVMPEHRNLVGHLLDHGFGEVWTLDFRMSSRFPYNTEPHRYTLDDVALYDHPAALAELRRHVGDRRVHVIAHCLGAMTFAMSLFGGAVTGIHSMTALSVALVARVPSWSRVKLELGPVLAGRLGGLRCLDPRGAHDTPLTPGWLLSRLVSLVHQECDNPACHMASFMWGSGWPALYLHGNLAPETHERIADLLGPTGLSYYRHLRKVVRAGHAVKYAPADPRHRALPDDYLAHAARNRTPVLLLTGDRNHVFGDSNVECHRRLAAHGADRYELCVVPGYGHQDLVIGKDAHRDVFPHLLDFLVRRGEAS
ncbi:alpha/beta fold hydrolase [Streptomyces sp. NPDC005876]|jgi:pimeloyl-ACP methyl ester carboxylesterase|uniref:alpha/beta fold hydrolase n=1 Tax=unclassified Streptomyces TaxID=2593676 RepID=UPI0033C25D3B